ncbi:hypothetical protein MSAN_00872200 [Mycena sanguinolenta]|uniref:Chromo domain-containing protein n=1 Tax=Mycena sanguinolenta TaxID=230812 RepID=A0A8H6Z1B6_9AGAR|nr:hypothetical protein MSAN_00872200 [Mycena sanguinolenta]
MLPRRNPSPPSVPLRRNPPRIRPPTRRPDEVVSYAPVSQPILVSSSQSSDHPILPAADEVEIRSHENSVEMIETNPVNTQGASELEIVLPSINRHLSSGDEESAGESEVVPQPTNNRRLLSGNEESTDVDPTIVRDEMAFLRQVDAPSLTFEERVGMLISQIHRLEGRPELVAESPEPAESVFSIENGGSEREDEPTTNDMYFIGIQTTRVRCTFIEVLSMAPPDHTLIRRLATGTLDSPLRGIRHNQADFYIGTSRCPIDAADEYMNHAHGFRELGSWSDLESANNTELSMLSPVPASAERTRLLARYGLSEYVPVYVLYIYHQENDDIWSSPPAPVAATSPPASVPVIPASNSMSNSSVNAETYLETHFASRLAQIRRVKTLACNTTYRNCTQEKHIIAICTTVGLNMHVREWTPVVIPGGPSISYNGIIRVAGLIKTTFAGVRTQVRNGRDARRLLARVIRKRQQTGWTASNSEEEAAELDRKGLLETLEILLREGDVDETFLDDTTNSPQARALHMRWEQFKVKVAEEAVTVVCVHTLETVNAYEEGPEIRDLAKRLVDLTWGQDLSGDRPFRHGIFELPGMKVNLRSKHVDSNAPAGDGSFNLASTHGEGEGPGHFGPAVQTNTLEAAATIMSILKILHRLYRLVMPLCISRFEWDIMESSGYENNVLAFGGLDPGPPSCQVNSSSAANVINLKMPHMGDASVASGPQPPDASGSFSSSPSSSSRRPSVEEVDDEDDNPFCQLHPMSPFTILEPVETETPTTRDSFTLVDLTDLINTEFKKSGALDASIGPQGQPHGDFKDDPAGFTLFVLLFRLPPGSDMGPFLWMHGAIYVRESDQYILFMAFKGQDIHTGSAPTYIKTLMEDFPSSNLAKELFKRFGIQPIPSSNSTPLPSIILFSPADSRADKRRYYISHGDTVMGDARARANRLAREGAYALKNYFLQCNIGFGFNVNELLEKSTFVDESGAFQRIEPTPIDIKNDGVYRTLCLYRRFYFWWKSVMSRYSLGVTKPLFKQCQKQIKDILGGSAQHRKGLPTERNLIRLPHKSNQSSGLIPRIEKIVGRCPNGRKGIWTIILEGTSEEVEYTEEEAFELRSSANDEKFTTYLNRNGNGPPPPSSTLLSQHAHPNNDTNDTGNTEQTLVYASTAAVDVSAAAVAPPNNNGGEHRAGFDVVIVTPLAKPAPHAQTHSDEPVQLSTRQQKRHKRAGSRHAQTSDSVPHKRRRNVAFSDSETECAQNDEPNDELSDHGTEYEVHSILSWRRDDGLIEWKVRWKGYDESYDEWLDVEQLSGSQELLQEFNRKNNVPEASEYDPTPTPPDSDDEYRLPETSKPRKPQPKRVADAVLRKFLDSVDFQKECDAMKITGNILERTNDHRHITDSPQHVASCIIQQIEQQNNLSTQMYFEFPSTAMGSQAWSSRLAGMTLRCITDLGSSLPDMFALSHVHDLMSRGTAGQICHAWPASTGTRVQMHFSKNSPSLRRPWNTFLPLSGQQQLAAAKKPPKPAPAPRGRPRKRKFPERAERTTEDTLPAVPEPSLPKARAPAPSAEIPGDLWGLLPTGKAKIKLRQLFRTIKLNTDNEVYKVASKVLCGLWDEHLILRPARDIEWWLNQHKAKSEQDISLIRDRCIVGGAILQCLSDSFGDGLFVSNAIYELLRHPCQIFEDPNARASH